MAVAGTILIFDYANILFLFRGFLVGKPTLVMISIAIVICLWLAIIRLLALANRNRENHLHGWTYIPGILLTGGGLLGVPVICALAVLPLAKVTDEASAPLFPFILMRFICTGLYMIPDSNNNTREKRQNRRILETEQHYSCNALVSRVSITAGRCLRRRLWGLSIAGLGRKRLLEGNTRFPVGQGDTIRLSALTMLITLLLCFSQWIALIKPLDVS
ncbi:hypothetical protein J7E73_23260 [Paenibacillus albidus]|uniref:hypothetical protein n=1 Tax=Paenibacillus albidus TaxID=2041023 RepID=UPI001BEA554E|nr:hypothetical protein [Paenibacillus albidus]MBT2291995.1 hypothetical protein [Paenibacillus albidus]